jgi:hypothetical protein
MNVHEHKWTPTVSQQESLRGRELADDDAHTGLVAELFRRLEARGFVREPGKGAPVEWEDETEIDRSSLDRWLKAMNRGERVRLGKDSLKRVRAYLGRAPTPASAVERRAIVAVIDEMQAKLDELRRIYAPTEDPVVIPLEEAGKRD